MIERDQIEAVIPHKGAMCLWDQVTAWDAATIRLRARGHRDPAHPLRSGGRLRAVHLCEYGAQAMAVHGGLQAQASGRSAPPGLLVALRGVALHVVRIDDLPGDLECSAEALAQGADSQQYAFRIVHRDVLLAEGRATVMLRADGGANIAP